MPSSPRKSHGHSRFQPRCKGPATDLCESPGEHGEVHRQDRNRSHEKQTCAVPDEANQPRLVGRGGHPAIPRALRAPAIIVRASGSHLTAFGVRGLHTTSRRRWAIRTAVARTAAATNAEVTLTRSVSTSKGGRASQVNSRKTEGGLGCPAGSDQSPRGGVTRHLQAWQKLPTGTALRAVEGYGEGGSPCLAPATRFNMVRRR